MSSMYTTFAEQYDNVVQDNIYNAYLERPSLQAMLGDVNGCDVIDLGCGSGVYADYFIHRGVAKLTCIDYSPNMIEIVKRKFGDRVTAYAQDASIGLIKEASESADLIISPLMIHYLEDLSVLFNDVARVLKNGGSFAFSTHHPFADFECTLSGNYFEREFITEMWNTVGEPVEVTFYRRSLTEIMNAITDSGLVVTQLSEGKVAEEVKQISLEKYEYLSKNPNFIFIKCQKLV
ncbi:methyltransferase domain-containing protein [Aliivibrio fischeri]|uniref:class I SAM-dependent DNA methyltransferase n=1 Tax=Aliivibrio fischeri TaxID=668 RepID=UPI0007C50AA0|nr:class I SAM-dependent methyltransferase [Aliivibrio fischeri]MUK60842.1 methyltransferase domain-containing protein [Aliivibrio fischeri]MUL16068.1 methyltransferase domain-containing protein [Aliivibrio fischeri]MUL20652.1 methyltransferase domain-containing protein [Aliivibrio fischeri]MUL24427.1 methyltransferase domain-containing protein [Aliivibrio fischeri]